MLPTAGCDSASGRHAEKRQALGQEREWTRPPRRLDQQLVALRDSKSNSAEAYRNLRSSLLLSSIDNPPRIIVVTSAFPEEGKTTTAINTAIVLAQRGEKVLLVDGDLRRGSLGAVFGLSDRSFGLSTVLANPHSISAKLPFRCLNCRPFMCCPPGRGLPTRPRCSLPAAWRNSSATGWRNTTES